MSDRIDEYHGADAKVLTTAEVERWQEFFGDGIQLRRTLSTTRALEKAERESREYRDTERKALHMCSVLEQERDACAAELADRYDAKQAVANAESERDAARRELAELALDVGYGERPEGQGGIIHADGKTLARTWLLERKEKDQAVAERDAARATIAELVTALEGLFVEYDHLRSAGSRHALTYWVDRLPDHACAECVPGGPIVVPGFRCREHAARAALAKAKEAKS